MLPALLHVVQSEEKPAEAGGSVGVRSLIDAGLVLYVGLLVLGLWRWTLWWKFCGASLHYANYVSLLLGLLFVLMGYDSYYFYEVATSDAGKEAWDLMPHWLRPCILAAPFVCVAIYLLASVQTFQHVERIREDSATIRHDRAVQIILLPAVYAVMALSSMVRMYAVVCARWNDKELLARSISRAETCFWVGDLYEAWALYQFGLLTLEVIKGNILHQENNGDEQAQAAARGLRLATKAVESLTWLGIISFVLVCVAEAGWSLWLLTFQSDLTAEEYDQSISQFTMAGFLASGAAIYNVFIVEHSYETYLGNYRPLLKFITVKILVTFAFVQKGFFKILMWSGNAMPGPIHNFFATVPIIGEVMKMDPPTFEIFYACLMIVECALVCAAHYWAWGANEEWYDQDDEDNKRYGTFSSF